VERRFSLLAGHPQALIRRAVQRAWIVAAIVAAMASFADAKPKRRDAKAQYDRGVAHYQLGNFEAAATALSKSFELERDVDTVFAWAQAERMRNKCDRAIELYEQALSFKMPAANRTAIQQKVSECRAILAQKPTPPVAEPVVEPPPVVSKPPELAPVVVEDRENPLPDTPPPPPVASAPSSSAWYKDPIALGLLGTGLVAGGVAVGFELSARSLDKDFDTAPDHTVADELRDKAESRRNLARISGGVGGALVVGGVVWMMLHRNTTEKPTVTGWVMPDGGGIAVAGGF
jgi:tetratricopeptide (TPR) repeat protein